MLHYIINMLQDNSQNSSKKFTCDVCHYTCSKKNDMNKHFNSMKHIRNIDGNIGNTEIANIELKCLNCNKLYKSRVGLWRHKKKCTDENNIIIEKELTSNSSEVIHLTKLVITLMNSNEEIQKQNNNLQKQTYDLQKQMIDVCKNSNNTINSHNNNKTFNMQVFLNEKCKDAMNIMEFVDSFTMQLSDLEDVGELGYVDGISNIIIKKLNEMDVYKRPVHCSDSKRETLFVKDNNVWEKEESGRDTLRRAIKYISKKNSDLLPAWSEKNPASQNIQSKRNDDYIKLVLQSMGGRGDIKTNENKIIKKISKSVLIDKSKY